MPSGRQGRCWRCSSAFGAPVENLRVISDVPAWPIPALSDPCRPTPGSWRSSASCIRRSQGRVDLKGPAVGFEGSSGATACRSQGVRPAGCAERPAFQPLERDFAFVVGGGRHRPKKLIKAAKGADKALRLPRSGSRRVRRRRSAKARSRSPSGHPAAPREDC